VDDDDAFTVSKNIAEEHKDVVVCHTTVGWTKKLNDSRDIIVHTA
jgi:hypothetical protein